MKQPLVILDKSFLQAESRVGRRLRALEASGCMFVLTDTLIYETCTGSRATLWQEMQRKMFPYADSIQVWWHTGELLERELSTKEPAATPLHAELTERTRQWFRSGQEHVADRIAEFAEDARKKREVDSINSLVGLCRTLETMVDPVGKQLRNLLSQGEDVSPHCNAIVQDVRVVNRLIEWAHGKHDNEDVYLPGGENGLDSRWFAFHHARSTLALLCVFLTKYSPNDTPGKEFRNTKLDSDYLALLHYADGLATNESSGSMSDMRRWLYGNSKTVFSTTDVDAALPTEDEIRLAAFLAWAGSGRTHGHDEDDWLGAEHRLFQDVWRRLSEQNGGS